MKKFQFPKMPPRADFSLLLMPSFAFLPFHVFWFFINSTQPRSFLLISKATLGFSNTVCILAFVEIQSAEKAFPSCKFLPLNGRKRRAPSLFYCQNRKLTVCKVQLWS